MGQGKGVTPKDVALYIISRLTTSGATGYFVEYAGDIFTSMTMEGRMTVCNLSIEMGARGGNELPDDKTFDYIQGREFTPTGATQDNAERNIGIHCIQTKALLLTKSTTSMRVKLNP